MAKLSLTAVSFALVISVCLAIDPNYAINITVYHVNEKKFGPIPRNMDTGDAAGDMFFDMLEVISTPLKCASKHHFPGGPNPCTNQEAVGKDLMVNKLTLEVDSRFSGYAMCNVGVDGKDPFGRPCPADTYCCICTSAHSYRQQPCNSTIGFESVYGKFSRYNSKGCHRSLFDPFPSKADCYTGNVLSKLSSETPGKWYSTLEQGYCGSNSTQDCTWRVVSVDKVVKRECHTAVFGATVAATAPDCFSACGKGQSTNTSSPCWVDCFYKAALGPDSGKPGGAVAGMSSGALIEAWKKPFLPIESGGCAPQL